MSCLRVEAVHNEVCPGPRPYPPAQPSRASQPCPSTLPMGTGCRGVGVTTAEKWRNTRCLESLHARSPSRQHLHPPDVPPLLPWSKGLKQPATVSSLWTLGSGIGEVTILGWIVCFGRQANVFEDEKPLVPVTQLMFLRTEPSLAWPGR